MLAFSTSASIEALLIQNNSMQIPIVFTLPEVKHISKLKGVRYWDVF